MTTVTSLLRQRLLDLLEDRRVVVWYDPPGHFREFMLKIRPDGVAKILAADSRLRARREAEAIFAQLNEADAPAERNRHLLIYLPWARGQDERSRLEDPFESFAVAGTTFGVAESETLQALARQAMPAQAAEIDRLFREGCPTLDLLDDMARRTPGVAYPLLKQALRLEAPSEIVAAVLCRNEVRAALSAVQGTREELLRLAEAALGFTPPSVDASLEVILDSLGRFVLFSEFVFDLPADLPDALSGVPRADEARRQTIYDLCSRMRSADDTRDEYLDLANRVEQALNLPAAVPAATPLGTRDTFAFEEGRILTRVGEAARRGDLPAARELVIDRRKSIWAQRDERAILWQLAGRCLDLLETLARLQGELPAQSGTVAATGVAAWVNMYRHPEGLHRADLHARRVEQGAAECTEHEDTDALVEHCRSRYQEFTDRVQAGFLGAVSREGWPPEGVLRQTQTFDRSVAPALAQGRRVAFFLVDGLRYEMARDLIASLETLGEVSVQAAASVLPTTTPFGMAALMPGADGNLGHEVSESRDVVPTLGGKRLPDSKSRMDLLRSLYGDRFADITLGELLSASARSLTSRLAGVDLLVVKTQDIDGMGEGSSVYHARKYMGQILPEINAACDRLARQGIQRIVMAADHGHVLRREILPGEIVAEPPGDWYLSKRRCRLGRSAGSSPGVTVMRTSDLGLNGLLTDLAVPQGYRVFSAGEGYFHEGISLQECMIPVVELELTDRSIAGGQREQVSITYRADRFTSRVIGLKVSYTSITTPRLTVKIQAFDGTGAKAVVVGEAADCEERDPATGLVTLVQGATASIPLRIADGFSGEELEVRATEPNTGVVHSRLRLKNSTLE